MNNEIAVFCGLDVGKSAHHATAWTGRVAGFLTIRFPRTRRNYERSSPGYRPMGPCWSSWISPTPSGPCPSR